MQPDATNVTDAQSIVSIDSGLPVKVQNRIPLIIEGLADGLSVNAIADKLGVDRTTIWRNLQMVDFAELNSMLVTDIIADIPLIENVYQRNWLRAQLLGKLHSKKLKSESTVKIHSREEKVNVDMVLDKLDFDTQRKIAAALQSDNGTINEDTE